MTHRFTHQLCARGLIGLLLTIALITNTRPVCAQIVDPRVVGNVTTTVCINPSDTLYEIALDIQSPALCPFTSYTITWDALNRSQGERITQPGVVKHQYRLTDFLKNCGSGIDDGERLIKVVTDCNGDNRSFSIFFKIKPSADFTVPDICPARLTSLLNQSCPRSSDTRYLWTFPDGTTSTAVNPSRTFPTTGTTGPISLSTSNVCGASTKTKDFPIRRTPVAQYTTMGYTITNQDTVVCLGNGGTLTLDGTVSIDGSRYQWTITPATYKFIGNTNSSSGVVKIQFLKSGPYDITLTAINDCGTSAPMKCTHRVVDVPQITLTPQPDACEATSYTLTNPTPNAVYTLSNGPNSQTLVANQVVSLPLSTLPYIVRGLLSNQCGATNTPPDTFLVQAPQPVQILAPARQSALCVGSVRVPLTTNLTGGTWDGSGKAFIEMQTTNAFFNPKTLGAYELIYGRGVGVCRRADTVRVAVEGGQVTAQSLSSCDKNGFIKLQGSPAGGVWQSPAFPTAVRHDTLFLAGIAAPQISLIYRLAFGTAGCPASASATVSIGRPKAAFTENDGCVGIPLSLTNISSGAGTFQWSLNNVVSSTDKDPKLTPAAGTVQLRLIATSGGCADTLTRPVTITAPPAPLRVTPGSMSGCSPLTVTLTPDGTARTDLTYAWNFGDGSSSTVFQPPAHTYRNQSRLTQTTSLTFSARNSCGTQTYSLPITVRPLAKAEIGVDSTTFRCAPARVKFSNRSTGQSPPSTWQWDDGGQPQLSAADTLSHLFTALDSARTFRVRLLVSSDCGVDADTVAIRIFPTTVKPLFTISRPAICPGESIRFTDATTPKPSRWIWQFSDGITAGTASPQRSFTQPNTTYTVSLTAITDCGYASTQKTICTTGLPTGDFRLPATAACLGTPVSLTNVTNPAFRFSWDFGDGTPADSVHYSPSHIFTRNSLVTLTIFGASTSCQNTLLSCKNVLPAKAVAVLAKPAVRFSVDSSNSTCAPGPVRFVNTSQNAGTWLWRFSDGRVSRNQTPELPFEPGTYSVVLTGISEAGCRDSTLAQSFSLLACKVYVPEVFTPNNDGTGDVWTLFGDSGIKTIGLLRVRSRWGEVIYEALNIAPNDTRPGIGWDGTFRGLPMPAGVYAYETEIHWAGDRVEKRAGTFTLLR